MAYYLVSLVKLQSKRGYGGKSCLVFDQYYSHVLPDLDKLADVTSFRTSKNI